MSTGCIIKNISAGYDNRQILDRVNLICTRGELTAVLGPNGSGKTTLFKSLMKIDVWVQGECIVGDKDVLRMRPKERARLIALLPQDVHLPPGYRCLDVLLSGTYPYLSVFGKPNQAQIKRMHFLSDELGITELLECDFLHLSTGQRQLALLARTLLQDSDVILMDEPDSGLDFEHKHQMMRYFSGLLEEKNKTGLMILHEPALVLAYCHHVYLMKEGRILTEIEPKRESKEEIQKKLSLLYPHIELFQAEGRFYPDYR